ncbi:MAG TPA: outer membrane protein transport protein [Isosphaeraceae bacterium]|nr:outer membrane protein transport protein [Isosphaeraceae bacterium]
MRRGLSVCLSILLLGFVTQATMAQGLISPSAGPINAAMAGASTAAPVDFGASYWNPATLSGLENQEFLLGSALAIPSTHMQSGLQANAILGKFPPTNRFGQARSDSGVASGLATGAAFRLSDDSPWTLGVGIFGMVGGNVNFAGSQTTPILTPKQPPNFFGVGPIFANLSLISVNPMASLRLTDKLSVGGGPVITSGTASFSPAFFARGPRDANGLITFPAATNARPFWGAGFQLGLFYELNEKWNLGFSYKSPVWQERWSFNSAAPDLSARRIGVQATLPEILSWGVAYKGLPKTLIDVDLRYFDYANTALFGTKVVDGGLGWRSVFAVATGAQYQMTDRLTLRAGYLFNTNPIRDTATLFNVQAPGIIQHTLSLGSSYQVTENVTFSLAWLHGFRNAIEGSILERPGSSVRLDAQVDVIWLGFNVSFGAKRRASQPADPAPTPQTASLPATSSAS